MRRYWLLDQHGGDGPTALVETDGSLHIVEVLEFGPGITEVEDQQKVWDQVIGRVAPTMKPLVDAGSLEVEGEAPNAKLRRRHDSMPGSKRGRGQGGLGGAGRATGGPSRKRSRGDR